jgi:DNA-binding response OmpR family regulator
MIAKRLLIIDDEADFGVTVRRVAEKLGFEVEITMHGRDFKRVFESFDPTVIIMDMVMPDVEGTELIEWLASVKCLAHIIIISGFAPVYATTAVRLGEARGLLSISRLAKPVSMADLTASLKAAVP